MSEPKDNTKIEVMLKQMGRSVEELKSSEQWRAMLKVQARFHRYSASNLLMILLQNPQATRVAGFRQWQGLNRQVQKGEKSIKIFAPMTRKDKDDPDKTKLVGFKLVSVFDIDQTEGDPLDEVPWPEAQACPDGLYATIKAQVEALGFTVEEPIDEPDVGIRGARGWYVPNDRTIHVREATEAGMCATLLHEVGHALDPKLNVDTDRARRELVAESVAMVLGMQMGVELEDEVTHYLASWGAGVDELLAVMDRIRTAVAAFEKVPVPA